MQFLNSSILKLLLVCNMAFTPALALANKSYSEKNNTSDKRLAERVELGRLIFMDKALSEPMGQACASCHQPDKAFADPGQSVSAGANLALFGNRNAPSISYVRFNPEPTWNEEDETWIGGFFLDGRAKTLRDQAKGPLLNPLEMGNHDAVEVMGKIKRRPYAERLTRLYSAKVWQDADKGFEAVTEVLAAYENHGAEFATFSSKYDAYLRHEVELTAQEKRGLDLFEDEKKGNCSACHPSKRDDKGHMPLFTDFSYDNIGVPRNSQLLYYSMAKIYNPGGREYVDIGLGNTKYASEHDERGKFKVQTLRNIARTAPYMHNGVFKTLKEVIEFYSSRDTDKKWAKPELSINVNKDELGDLKLTNKEIDDIEAFLNTLTDGYKR